MFLPYIFTFMLSSSHVCVSGLFVCGMCMCACVYMVKLCVRALVAQLHSINEFTHTNNPDDTARG